MIQGKRYEFSEEGVVVTLPDQAKRARVVKLPLVPPEGRGPGRRTAGEFQPGRLVINIGVVEEDNPDVFLEKFNPPFELRVRYSSGDMQRATSAGQPLQLAFWDGSQWVRFTHEKHQFEIVPDANGSKGGTGVALISHWGDPPVGWGP